MCVYASLLLDWIQRTRSLMTRRMGCAQLCVVKPSRSGHILSAERVYANAQTFRCDSLLRTTRRQYAIAIAWQPIIKKESVQ